MSDIFDLMTNSSTVHEFAGRIGYVTVAVSVFNLFAGMTFIAQFLFRDRRVDVFIVLYLLLISSDMLASSTGLSIGYKLSRYQHPGNISDSVVCVTRTIKLMNSLAFSVSARFSTAVACVLAVVRCVVLHYPLNDIRGNPVYSVMLLCGGVTILSIFIPFAADSYSCPDLPFPCRFIWFGGGVLDSVLSVGLPLILPALTALVTLGAMLTYKTKHHGDYNIPSCHTVMFLTVNSLICTTLCATAQLTPFTTSIASLAIFLRCFLNSLVFIARNSLHRVRSPGWRKRLFSSSSKGAVASCSVQQEVVSNQLTRASRSQPSGGSTTLDELTIPQQRTSSRSSSGEGSACQARARPQNIVKVRSRSMSGPERRARARQLRTISESRLQGQEEVIQLHSMSAGTIEIQITAS